MQLFVRLVLWVLISIIAIKLYKNKKFAFPQPNTKVILFTLAVVYALLTFLGLWLEHNSFHTYAKDLTVYTQALSNWRLYSPILGHSLLSDHFSPILYFLVPLGKLFDSPYLLFFLQTILLILPIFPLYKIARHFYLPDWPALLMVVLYLNLYYVRALALSDFHVELFIPLMFTYLGETFLSGKRKQFWFWLGLSFLIKEDIGFYLGAWFLILSTVLSDKRKLCWQAGMLSFLVGIIALASLLPANGGVYPHFANWQHYGEGLTGIITGAVTHPVMSIGVWLQSASFQLFIPLLGLPLMTVWGWAMLPTLWVQLASALPSQSHLMAYYPAPVIPLIMIALIAGWDKIVQWLYKKNYRNQVLMVIAAFLLAFNTHWIPWQAVEADHWQITKLLKKIPEKGMIYAQGNIAPQIKNSERVRVLGLNRIDKNPDIIIFHIKGNIWPFNRAQYLSAINKMRINTKYKLWRDQYGIQIYVRNK